MIVAVLVLVLVLVVFVYQWKTYRKWKRLNVPGPEPLFLLGNMKKFITLKASVTDVYTEIYRKFSNSRYIGVYLMNRPAILLRDPDLIEEVLVKKFSHFHDNDIEIKKDDDPVFGDNPFVAKGEVWKRTRTQHLTSLTPAKVKGMFLDVEDVGNKMVSFLHRSIDDNGGNYCMDALELMARYTTDVVTSCTLSMDGKSFNGEVPQLRNAGKGIFEPNMINTLKMLAVFLVPSLANYFAMRVVPFSLGETYKKMVREMLKYRESNNITKNDFFDNIKEFRGRRVSVGEMTAQVGAVFIDGFGTNSSALNFMIYELAENFDMQNNLRDEVNDYLKKSDGKLSYDGVLGLKYLDAFVKESLRKYPPFAQLSKVCTHEHEFPKSDEKSSKFKVEVGTTVIIPIYAIQHDEKYYPEPEKFKPDRFLGENAENIKKYTYIPFGEGPRVCIGFRFAMLQSKMALVKLVQNFDMRVNYKKTKIPIEFDPRGVMLAAKGRIWINFTKRTNA